MSTQPLKDGPQQQPSNLEYGSEVRVDRFGHVVEHTQWVLRSGVARALVAHGKVEQSGYGFRQ